MPYTLTFNAAHKYNPSDIGITVPVVLSIGERAIKFLARIDTGATFCIFERELGEDLGLDIESGTPQRIGTATGSFLAYGHDVLLSALGYQLDATVYFAAISGFNRNVLGRRGWLDRMRLGIIDYDGKLYASKYDEV